MIIDEPYSSRETVPNIRPADRESRSAKLHCCLVIKGGRYWKGDSYVYFVDGICTILNVRL